jgi:hypothetical protein
MNRPAVKNWFCTKCPLPAVFPFKLCPACYHSKRIGGLKKTKSKRRLEKNARRQKAALKKLRAPNPSRTKKARLIDSLLASSPPESHAATEPSSPLRPKTLLRKSSV